MGRGVAKLLAQKGAHVVIVARTAAKLEAAVKYISVSSALCAYHLALLHPKFISILTS